MTFFARAVLVMAVVVVGSAACGGDDQGDVEAFCGLAIDGVGMRPANDTEDLEQLQALEEAAPPDIEVAVTTVANASREIEEIEDLRELFRRAFDLEEAVAQARQEIRAYTQHHCL
ncbi:hypothetical protein [Candidatus Poriferisocius sp.]|uniref:hypothetical protein n=1 Tax=Candidatus Poriferisocius sp. TaxID=3101276 RepID=UPI003B591331